MKKLVLAASLALVSACSTLPDSQGPFARSSQGATASDAVDQGSTASPYPAETDQGIF